MSEAIETFCKAVQAKCDQHGRDVTISFKMGQKYAKIIESGRVAAGRAVFCFVDRQTGNIFKSASWNTPAKHVRGNIANGASDVTPYGAQYLR